MSWNLRRNLALKLFSLLLAIVCWYVVRSEEDRVRDYTVPLEYVNLNPTLELSGRTVDTVTVRVRATEPLLKTITEDRISARIDLSRAPLGEQFVPLRPETIQVPGGAEVAWVQPESVTIRIEKRMRREVPVVAEFSGVPARGFEKLRYDIDPPVVSIEGPASEVGKVKTALAGTILLDGERSDFDVSVTPVPDAPAGSRVHVVSPPGPIKVRVVIRPAAGAAPRPSRGR